MANRGTPNSNNSQFSITFTEAPWLDDKSVVFGQVIDGFNVVKMLNQIGTKTGLSSTSAYISESGELPMGLEKQDGKIL